ncbi:MAG: ribonuclease E activity regulator RraA [Gammaproteobacteria bacterium]
MTFHTADLCDDHEDKLQIVAPLFSIYGGRNRFHGRISTIKAHEDNSLVREAVAEPGEGRVLVIDGGGSLRRAMLGDMLAEKATKNGWSGVLINGCLRDSEAIGELDLGVKALATLPLKTEKRGEGQRDIPVHFADATFTPGHWLYSDPDGIVICAEQLPLAR